MKFDQGNLFLIGLMQPLDAVLHQFQNKLSRQDFGHEKPLVWTSAILFFCQSLRRIQGSSVRASDDSNKKKGQYATFWKVIKLGIIEDATNRNRLVRLLRFEM